MQNKTAANAWAFEILILDSLIKLKKELHKHKTQTYAIVAQPGQSD